MDRTGRWIITAGGIGVILSVLGIFLFVLMESYPLFLKPSVSRVHTFDFSHRQPVLCTGVDPYQAVMFVVHDSGIDFVDMTTKSVTKSVSIPLNYRDGVFGQLIAPWITRMLAWAWTTVQCWAAA